MKIARAAARRRGIELLPLIDLIFLLLAAFIYATQSMTVHRALPVELPGAATGRVERREYVTVTVTRAGAIWSMVVGFVVTAFWLLLVKAQEASAIGLVQKLTGGKPSILHGVHNWPVVDPLFVALPLSVITLIVVSLLTKRPDDEHLGKCFETSAPR